MKILKILIAVAMLAAALSAQTGTEPPNAGFTMLRTLVGDWEGTVMHEGHAMPASTSFRLVADGSAILDDLAPGTPHEMVTVFHMDGTELLATHYCSHHNQPRLRALPQSSPNVLEFAFKDATNLKSPADPHMTAVKFTIIDANHHVEEWRATANGQPVTLKFDVHRKM